MKYQIGLLTYILLLQRFNNAFTNLSCLRNGNEKNYPLVRFTQIFSVNRSQPI